MKHAKGPWAVFNLAIGHNANGPYSYPLGYSPNTAVANAERLVACVNGCDAAGVTKPEALAELMRQAVGLRSWLDSFSDSTGPPTLAQVKHTAELWRAALRAVRGV